MASSHWLDPQFAAVHYPAMKNKLQIYKNLFACIKRHALSYFCDKGYE
jgi:hypothetical protein